MWPQPPSIRRRAFELFAESERQARWQNDLPSNSTCASRPISAAQDGPSGYVGRLRPATGPATIPGARSPDSIGAKVARPVRRFFWFCSDDVREDPLKSDSFEGTTDDGFSSSWTGRVWGRETQPFGQRPDEGRAWSRLGSTTRVDPATKPRRTRGSRGKATRKLPRPNARRSRSSMPATPRRAEIRKQYKSLVKDLRPDINGSNRDDKERLQEVNCGLGQDRRNHSSAECRPLRPRGRAGSGRDECHRDAVHAVAQAGRGRPVLWMNA